jgi:hypothetical protein
MKSSKLAEADEILDDHLLKSVKDNMPFSQKELFKHIRQAGFESSHIKHLPVTIPENMGSILKIESKISKLKEKLTKDKRRGLSENKQTVRRISELEKLKPKILTPKEELQQIKEKLLSKKGLPQNFEQTNAYQRLLDLSHVWHNARTLLNRVHLENEYNKQEAFKDLSNQVLKIADSDSTMIAHPDDVIDYMKRRIEGNLNKVEPIVDVMKAVDASEKVPADSDSILDEQAEQFKNTEAQDAKGEFIKSSERFKEFKGSENIFKNLIACVIGGIGG